MAMRVLALAIVAVGCARTPAARLEPQPLLHAWSEAIAHDDPHAAYQLLSSVVKARLTEPDFTLQWKAAPAELTGQRDALRAATVARRSSVQRHHGGLLVAVHEEGQWRLTAPRPSDGGSATPEEALQRFVEAVDARDFDAVLRLLADPLRSTLEQAVTERLEKLRSTVKKGAIEIGGDHARIRYDSRYHIDLINENGSWRIRDLN